MECGSQIYIERNEVTNGKCLRLCKMERRFKLKKDVFNEIDGLILSRLSYFPLEQLLEENEEITIEEFAKRFEQTDKTTLRILWEDDKELIPLIGKSERFGK